MTASLLTLPPELFDHVLAYIGQIHDGRQRAAELARVCRTCRRLWSVTQPKLDRLVEYDGLYRTIEFNSRDADGIDLVNTLQKVDDSIQPEHRGSDQEPSVFSWTINFRLVLHPDSAPYEGFHDIFVPFLHNFTNLKCLCLEDPNGEGIINLLPRQYDLFPCLEQLTLTASHKLSTSQNELSADQLMPLWCSPRLKMCVMEEVEISPSELDPDWPVGLPSIEYLRLFRVRLGRESAHMLLDVHRPDRLSVRAVDYTYGSGLWTLLSLTASSLSELQFEYAFGAESWVYPDLTPFHNLKRLALDPRNLDELMERDFPITKGMDGRYAPHIKFPPTLERLDMAVDTDWIHRLRFSELLANMITHKAEIFPRLTELHLYFTPTEAVSATERRVSRWSHRDILIAERIERGLGPEDGLAANGETIEFARIRQACSDANINLTVGGYPKWDFLHSWWSSLDIQPQWTCL